MLSDRQRNRLVVQTRLVRCHVARRDKNFLDVDVEDAASSSDRVLRGGAFRGQPPTELGGGVFPAHAQHRLRQFLGEVPVDASPIPKNRSYRS